MSRKLVSRILLFVAIISAGLLKWCMDASQVGALKMPQAFSADTPIPDFSAIQVIHDRKYRFFSYLLPAIEAENARIMDNRQVLESLLATLNAGGTISGAISEEVIALAAVYGLELERIDAQTLNELLIRVAPIPTEMVMIQAANESGWGTSRFAREGNNYFGQWCYSAGCGLVPNQRASGSRHEVRLFSSPYESVHSYFMNINTHAAYQALREKRAKLMASQEPVTAQALIATLSAYSERGQAYIDALLSMIRHNQQILDEVLNPSVDKEIGPQA
ncbi:glucosaminidase domain-containing protein [Vibrio stylophorae]|nr:glucosaminidase domain-containing protein [Vibrio stylophorae]